MSTMVREIMNPEVFRLRPSDSVRMALDGLLGLGISGAPVVDARGKPLGVVSLRDLLDRAPEDTAGDRMNWPAAVIAEDAPVEAAAQLIGQTGYRRLVVVGGEGQVVGQVSAIDVLRALIGLPASHPAAFPHFDAKEGLTWTNDLVFDAAHLEETPDGPGILVLLHDFPGTPRRIVWAGSTHNLRTFLLALLDAPQKDPELKRWLAHPQHLLFRAASVTDPAKRERIAAALKPRQGPSLAPR